MLVPVARVPRPYLVVLALAASFVAACSQTPEKDATPDYGRALPDGQSALVKVTDPLRIPDFRVAYGMSDDLLHAIDGSIEYLEKPSSRNAFPMANITHERAHASLRRFRDVVANAVSPDDLHGSIVRDFDVYTAYGYDGRGSVLVTGYCTPIYDASLVRTEQFRYPLYRLPPEIVKADDGTPLGMRAPDGSLAPAPTRREIEEGSLFAARDLELAWLADPVDAYVVHVQGSARLRLPDGSLRYVGYAGKTDRPYSSLGRALVAEGKITKADVSLPAIRSWLAEHPEQVFQWLWRNESYVFFTEYPEGMPHGSLGFPVTPNRSIATDKSIFPRAAPVFLSVEVPASYGTLDATRKFRQFVLDQDTGGAIKAAGRADLYMGVGDDAERVAGRQKHVGRMYYLFLKEGAMPGR